MKVAVIGAGIMGSSLAFRLQQREGVQVTLVDQAAPGSGTTGASFAWINANRKLPREYFELNSAGMREHLELAREIGYDGWLHRTGNIMCATGDEVDDLRGRVDRLQRWGYDARWLDAGEAEELEPGMVFPEGAACIAYFPQEFWVEAPELAGLLVQLASGNGAETRIGDSLVDIWKSEGEVKSISLGSGERIEADTVVNACGVHAPEVAAMAGTPLEIEVKSGLMARLEIEQCPISRLIHTDHVNLRPEPLGGLIAHHDSVDRMLWEEREGTEELSALLLERAREIVPELEHARVSGEIIGMRPVPADGLPCVGAVPGVGGYYEAVTHSGITLGPLLGRLLAEEISSREPSRSLVPFRASRFR